MLRQLMLAGLASGVMFFGIGCKNCGKRRSSDNLPPPPGSPFLEPPVVPPLPSSGGADRIPSPSVPTVPGGTLPPPSVPESSGSFRLDPSYPPPASVPSPNSGPSPSPSQSAKPQRELLLPEPLPKSSGNGLIDPPELPSTRGYLGEPLKPSESAKVSPSPSPPPSSIELPPTSTTPKTGTSGLPGYTAVADKPGVYAGRKPTLDGFNSLKASGFRSVVYLHDPAADVSAAKTLVEDRGMKFVPIAVSPETLAKAMTEFNAVIADKAARSMYVCDEDGLRAGFAWYLHFRKVDLFDDDAARVRANPLGLRDATANDAKAFWIAAQDYLSK